MVVAVESGHRSRLAEHEIPVSPAPAATGPGRSRLWASRFGWTLATSIVQFVLFFLQGIVVANVLGPDARGEFGSILFFPRDLFLYVGLFGGVEMISSMAARQACDRNRLRSAAVKLALLTSSVTGLIALVCAVVFLWITQRLYLLPLTGVTLLFLAFDHLQLIVSGVDRGTDHFTRYNFNRLFHAAMFPALLLLIFGLRLNQWIQGYELAWVCGIFVFSRLLGVIPTLLGADPTDPSLGSRQVVSNTTPDTRPLQLLKQGAPFAWSMLATEAFERLDVLLILLLAGLSDAGNYLVAVPAAALATLIPNTLGLFAFNAGAKRSLNWGFWKWLGVVGAIAAAQVITVVLLWVLLPRLIPIFFGLRFEQAISFAIWLLPACAIKGYLQFADGYLKGLGAAWVGIRTRIVAIGLLLLCVGLAYSRLNLYAIPLAAGVAQAFCACVLTVALIRSSRLACPETSEAVA